MTCEFAIFHNHSSWKSTENIVSITKLKKYDKRWQILTKNMIKHWQNGDKTIEEKLTKECSYRLCCIRFSLIKWTFPPFHSAYCFLSIFQLMFSLQFNNCSNFHVIDSFCRSKKKTTKNPSENIHKAFSQWTFHPRLTIAINSNQHFCFSFREEEKRTKTKTRLN